MVHPKSQLKVFLEKSGIEPATPGLQGIGTAASLVITK